MAARAGSHERGAEPGCPAGTGRVGDAGFCVLLERLSPEERAVFLLKDVFDYEHSEVAEILGTTTENSRQLLHRAKARLERGGHD